MTKIAILSAILLLWRGVLPLKLKLKWKLPVAVLAVIVAFKFKIIQLIGGNYFSPELPAWVLIFAAFIYISAFIFMFICAITDTFLLGHTAGSVLCLFLKEKKFDYRRLFRAHPWLNKVHLLNLVLGMLLAVIGMGYGLAQPRIRQLDLYFDDLPQEAENFTITHLSDLHVDNVNNKARISRIVALANTLDPDVVCITGDFADGTKAHHLEALSVLSSLRSRYGTFAVPGNHEYYSGYRILTRHLEKTGLHMLYNDRILIPDRKIWICGVTDPQARRFPSETKPDVKKALSGLPENEFKLFLAHQPKLLRQSVKYGADLQLSGHTHGGMMWGFDRIVAAGNGGFAWGERKIKDTIVVISNGTCMWSGFPLRLGHPAEILLIRLKKNSPGHRNQVVFSGSDAEKCENTLKK